ncbi:MAG: hypothetical protein QMD16_11145 [Desulfitobacteriaceae bacterium]|nr:hypothetical protein [Desulfitobacteriaceae bacterium]
MRIERINYMVVFGGLKEVAFMTEEYFVLSWALQIQTAKTRLQTAKTRVQTKQVGEGLSFENLIKTNRLMKVEGGQRWIKFHQESTTQIKYEGGGMNRTKKS